MSSNPAAVAAVASNPESDPGGDGGHGDLEQEQQREAPEAVEAAVDESVGDGLGGVPKKASLVGISDGKEDAKKEELSAMAAAAATGGSTEGLQNSGEARGPDEDAAMIEAVEEVPVVTEAKVMEEEVTAVGDVAMMDAAGEEGDVATNVALYEKEMVPILGSEGSRDKSGDGAQPLNGGYGGARNGDAIYSNTVHVEAVAPEVMEVSLVENHDSANCHAALEHAIAGAGGEIAENESTHGPESNKVDKHSVNATPSGIGNEEGDNGIAGSNKETENNVVGIIEGGSKIPEDATPSVLEKHDDRSELPERVAQSGDEPDNNKIVSQATCEQCARYCLPPLDKGTFQVSDLVWGKVKSHPWWPGQIFDPSDASELALKYQKKGSHLIAYFGDNTFAWCDESQLKPFLTNYSEMEKQSSSDAFINSVNHALEEVSRRVLSGMSCSCLPEELSDNGMSYLIENAGVRDGLTTSIVDRSEILNYFSPENLLQYIKSLALLPGEGGDLLELVIACSQLTAFYRSKGCPELPAFQTGNAWVENDMEPSSSKSVMLGEAVIDNAHPSHEKPKRGRGRPPKRKHGDDLEFTEKKAASNLTNDINVDDLGEREMVLDFDDFDDLQNRKKRALDSFEDSETKSPTPTFGGSFKIGECIRRAASQLTGSSSIVKSQNEPMVHKTTTEAENGDFDISSDDTANELTVEKRAKRRRLHRHHAANPEELLSQLCLVATEPMNGYSFSAMLISYFSDYRNYVVSTTTEANIVEKVKGKRGRKRKILPAPEVETTDHMQDSYWSGFSLKNHPIHNLRRVKTSTWPRGRRRAYVPSSDHLSSRGQHLQVGKLSPKKQIQVIERAIIHVEEKIVDECKPTALVLSFARSSALPSESDLIRMFGRYGPLKQAETEVHRNTNSVKVVFKKRADAERAFSSAGKYGTFGPSLRSYRLVEMPFSLSTIEANNPEMQPQDRGLEIPAPMESEGPSDAMQVETVSEASIEKADMIELAVQAEALKEASVEQVDTIQQTGKSEAVKEASIEQIGKVDQIEKIEAESVEKMSVEQVDMVEDIGQVDAEQAVHLEAVNQPSVDQLDTKHTMQVGALNEASIEQVGTIKQAGQSEAVTEALAEQVDMTEQIRQVNSQKEASADAPLDTTQDAPPGAPVGDTHDQTKLVDAPNKTSVEGPSHSLQMDAVTEAPNEDAMVRGLHTESTQTESAAGASDGGMPDETKLVDAPTKTSVEDPSHTLQMEAAMEAPNKDAMERALHTESTQGESGTEASVGGMPDETMLVNAPTKTSIEDPLHTLQMEAATETPSEDAMERAFHTEPTQAEFATGASVGGTPDEIKLVDASNKTSIEVPSHTLQMEAAMEAPTEDAMEQALHTESTKVESASGASIGDTPGETMLVDDPPKTSVEDLSLTLQMEPVTEAPNEDAMEQTLHTESKQPESATGASVGGTPDETNLFDVSTKTSVEDPSYTFQMEAVTESRREDTMERPLHTESTQAESATGVSGGGTPDETTLVVAPTNASVEVPSHTLQMEAVTEASSEDTMDRALHTEFTQSESATGASVGGLPDETGLVDAPTKTSVEDLLHTLQEAATEAPSEDAMEHALCTESTNEESGVVPSDSMQVDAVTEAQEEDHVCAGSSVDKAVAEASAGEQVDIVEQTMQEAPVNSSGAIQVDSIAEALEEEHVRSDSLHFEALTKAAVEQVDVNEQATQEPLIASSIEVVPEASTVDTSMEASNDAMQIDAVDEDSGNVGVSLPNELQAEKLGEQNVIEQTMQHECPVEVPSDARLKVEPSTEETVDQDAIEQIMRVEAPIEKSVDVQSDAILPDNLVVQVSRVPSETVAPPVDHDGATLQGDHAETLATVSAEQVETIEQTVISKAVTNPVEALTKVSIEEAETIEQTTESKAVAEASTDRVHIIEQNILMEAVTETSIEHAGVEQIEHTGVEQIEQAEAV